MFHDRRVAATARALTCLRRPLIVADVLAGITVLDV